MNRWKPCVASLLLCCMLYSHVGGAADLAGRAHLSRRTLRVCADGNNLPFSNERGEGFENKLAAIVAADLGAHVAYTWRPQSRGFIRETLKAGLCDVIMGVPTALDMVATTRPYYRSGYVFVHAPGAAAVASLDAAELHGMRIGVPMVGDDGANPPPVLALATRGLIDNMHGYSVYGDYSRESPSGDIVRALRAGDIDVAIVWGPTGGYFATHDNPTLTFSMIPEAEAPAGSTFRFDISMAVRHGDETLRADLNRVLLHRARAVEALLAAYGIPRLPTAADADQ